MSLNFMRSRVINLLQGMVHQGVTMQPERDHAYTYEFPRPALTVDVVVVTRGEQPKVLLIKRAKDPFARCWAIPGGFVDENERLIDAAKRELFEETGARLIELEQLYTAGDPGRDPRGWTVSVVFLARVDPDTITIQAGDDARDAKWFPLHRLPKMAFDHAMILERAQIRLRDRTP